MKSLSLTAGTRLTLTELLGQQQGRLGELVPFHRIINLLRIDEEEGRELGLKVQASPEGGISATWDPSQPPKGFTLEDADALALLALLERWPQFHPSDLGWLLPLKDALSGGVL